MNSVRQGQRGQGITCMPTTVGAVCNSARVARILSRRLLTVTLPSDQTKMTEVTFTTLPSGNIDIIEEMKAV